MKKLPYVIITTLSTTLILSACGGSSDSSNSHHNDNTPPPIDYKPKTFQTNFTSSLTIEEKSEETPRIYNIKDQSSNEKDNQNVYSITTEVANSSISVNSESVRTKSPYLNQIISFDLEPNLFRLGVEYDPISKQATGFNLIKTVSEPYINEVVFVCEKDYLDKTCSGAVLNYDYLTGTAEINFSQAEFKSNSSLSEKLLIVDGTLKGTLSHPPKTIKDIPQVSSGAITIDGTTHQIIAATNTPQKIMGSYLYNAGISILLDNAINMFFIKSTNGLSSKYIDRKKDFLIGQPSNNKNLTFQDLNNRSQFTLLPTTFNFNHNPDNTSQKVAIISGIVEAPLPYQTMSITPNPSKSTLNDRDNSWYANPSYLNSNITPDDFTIRLINHNTVEISANDFTAIIQDKKLKSIQLTSLLYNPPPSTTAITGLILIDYQCGDTSPVCQGVTVEPNGYGIKFNNTVLTNNSSDNEFNNDDLPNKITLNGGLVYLGR